MSSLPTGRYLSTLILTTLTLFLFTMPALAADIVSVKKDGVNIRSGPGTEKEVLWEVFQGFPLQIVSRQGDWLKTVDFEGDGGWIFKSLVSDKKTVIVKVNTANMRLGPGTSYEVVATVKYGVVFQPLDKDGDWRKLQHKDGTTGWIHKKLIWPSE